MTLFKFYFQNFSQLGKFFLSGILNTILTFLLYIVLVKAGMDYLVANTLAWVLGIVISYVTNVLFVFNHKIHEAHVKRFFIFSLFYSTLFILSSLGLMFLIELKNYDSILAQFIVIPIIALISYTVSKLIFV